jgi:hypothetical protein
MPSEYQFYGVRSRKKLSNNSKIWYSIIGFKLKKLEILFPESEKLYAGYMKKKGLQQGAVTL